MKYIITDHNKIAMGSGCYHQGLKEAITGMVVSAGEFRIKDGKVEAFGESFGYGMKAKPEDAKEIERYLGIIRLS